MTIKEIYKMQKDLDDLIIKKKELEVDNKTLLTTRLLALFVELGELSEERRKAGANCKINPMGNRDIRDKAIEKALEEYVDCMHFVFSIANALDLEDYIENHELKEFLHVPKKIDFLIILSNFTNYISNWKYWKKEKKHDKEELYSQWKNLLNYFVSMSGTTSIYEAGSFKIEEIEEAYKAKMKKNYERQENNY
jgi:dimeric dUTPase (all-alpha-NTP-PPase superfamily)